MSFSYELHLEQFKGPLEKLLELIESEQLEITDISLAKVTDHFLSYLETLEKIEPAILADFIAIASRLILLKSKSLLPNLELSSEEEADIRDLKDRLGLYRELKAAKKNIDFIWRKGSREFSRSYFLHYSGTRVFYPGSSLTLGAMRSALEKLGAELERFVMEHEIVKDRVITLEEKIKEVISRIEHLIQASFQNLSERKSRSEIIILFLAILHLAREQVVSLEQERRFSDIIIKKNGNE